MLEWLNQIVVGDAALLLEQLPDGCIDLTVTSPPYDNLRAYNGYTFDFEAIALELYRVTKPGGVVVWVVGDATINGSETGTSFRQALYFKECGFNLHDTMIYGKNGAAYPSNSESVRYSQVFEYMFILSRGNPSTVHLVKDKPNRWAGSKTFGTRSNRDKSGELVTGKQRTVPAFSVRDNIWRINNGFGYSSSDDLAYRHPATFPEALARDHILSWSNPGDVVLDPMAGSGTTCKMAKELGRDYIGFDISAEYVELARQRVDGARVPLTGLVLPCEIDICIKSDYGV